MYTATAAPHIWSDHLSALKQVTWNILCMREADNGLSLLSAFKALSAWRHEFYSDVSVGCLCTLASHRWLVARTERRAISNGRRDDGRTMSVLTATMDMAQ